VTKSGTRGVRVGVVRREEKIEETLKACLKNKKKPKTENPRTSLSQESLSK
jgi:hypothetical protein